MKACRQWNLVLLCPKGEDRRSLVKDLKRLDQRILHGVLGFTPRIFMQKRTSTFNKQDVISLEEIEDIIFVMVYFEALNSIENVPSSCRTVPRVFYDHTSKYPTIQWDKKQRTLEEILQLINVYLPKELTLVLVSLSTSVQAIM